MSITKHIAGVPFIFDGLDSDDRLRLLAVWDELFSGVPGDAGPVAVSVLSRASSSTPVTSAPPSARHLHDSPGVSFWVGEDGGYWMRRSGLDCSMARDRMTFEIAPEFWGLTLFERRDAFLTAVSAQLRLRGVYGFHGNGLRKEGSSVLIVGDSGAGKTTLTLSLVSQGWDYLSDDALGLARAGRGIEARALRQGISLTEDAMLRWAGSAMWADAPKPLGSNKGKGLVLPGDSLKARFIPSCVPGAIFFCQRGDEETSRAIEIPKPAALGLCLRQALGLWMDSSVTKVHVELLKDLVDQAACYRIITGKDVIERPAAVSDLIFSASRRASHAVDA